MIKKAILAQFELWNSDAVRICRRIHRFLQRHTPVKTLLGQELTGIVLLILVTIGIQLPGEAGESGAEYPIGLEIATTLAGFILLPFLLQRLHAWLRGNTRSVADNLYGSWAALLLGALKIAIIAIAWRSTSPEVIIGTALLFAMIAYPRFVLQEDPPKRRAKERRATAKINLLERLRQIVPRPA